MYRPSGRVRDVILMLTSVFIFQTYFSKCRLILVSHKEVLLINCSHSDLDESPSMLTR